MSCVKTDKILSYSARLLAPEEATSVEEHLAQCGRCSRKLQDINTTITRLASDPQEFEDPALIDDVMTLIRLGRTGSKRPGRRLGCMNRPWFWAPLAASIVLFLILFLKWEVNESSRSSGFQARGSGIESGHRMAWVEIYRTKGKGYQPVRDQLRPDDALAFAYKNRVTDKSLFLMIFAVDEKGRIFWYYPAYKDISENPESLPIRKTNQSVLLPEEVQHELQPGLLKIFAVFSDVVLYVKTVEERIGHELARLGHLEKLREIPFPKTLQQTLLLQVCKGSSCQGG